MMYKTRKWSGWWIHGNSDPAPYLRKSFELEKCPEKALLHLCSPGWCELTINGIRPDDRVLSPVVTQFDKHVSYLTYDVTSLLREGRNSIVVLLGNGWYNCRTQEVWNFEHAVWLDRPKMICDLECDGRVVLVSDNTWKQIPSPIVFNQLRNGEKYDATREIPGVLEADFEDTAFDNAAYITPPAGVPVEEDNTPCRICRIIEGTCHKLTDQFAVWDFGENMTGWCEMKYTSKVVSNFWGALHFAAASFLMLFFCTLHKKKTAAILTDLRQSCVIGFRISSNRVRQRIRY